MPDLWNDRIDGTLKEAEGRLSSAHLDVVVKPPVLVSTSAPDLKHGASQRHKLALRNPRAASTVTQDNAGLGWFDLPRLDAKDKNLRRDFQLLAMRGTALDPKRHYKKDSLKSRMPRYAHVGRIIEGPTEFYNSRLTRRARKSTLVQELLAAKMASGRFKSKYQNIQTQKSSGKKSFYKNLVAHRRRRN